jgi:hypothetical protein
LPVKTVDNTGDGGGLKTTAREGYLDAWVRAALKPDEVYLMR